MGVPITKRYLLMAALTIGCLGTLLWSGTVQANDEFQRLVELGKADLRAGKLAESASRFLAASALKPSPRLLMTVVSLYGDMARKSEQKGAFCTESKRAIQGFVDACVECTAFETARCRLCRYVDLTEQRVSLAQRADDFAEGLKSASVEAAERAMKSSAQRAKYERKSRGLDGKSKDVRRCLGRITVTSNPSNATIRVADEVRGVTPETLLMFDGQVTVSVESPGRPVRRKSIRVKGEETRSLHLSIFNPIQGGQTDASEGLNVRGSARPAAPSSRRWLVPATGLALSLATVGVGAFLVHDSMQTQAEIEEDIDALSTEPLSDSPGERARRVQQVVRLQEDDKKNQEAHSRNLWILGSAGTAAVVTGIWLYLESITDDDSGSTGTTNTSTRLHLGPTGLVLSGDF